LKVDSLISNLFVLVNSLCSFLESKQREADTRRFIEEKEGQIRAISETIDTAQA
jgi:hypothetical protein